MMTTIVVSALLSAFVVYLGVGLLLGRGTRGVADLLPLGFGRQARVASRSEFSASTVATTISLATVVIAFFELARDFGIWLFSSVITTALGLLVVRLFAGRIWSRMQVYDHRPTLHEFLGTEYRSDALSYVGAACTSLGFLAAFAVELTVGSRFFAALVPDVPTGLVVVILSVVAFVYTAAGGFRAVIVTDRIQMFSIWLLLAALPIYYVYHVYTHGGWQANLEQIPEQVFRLGGRPGLWAFLLGILILNVPTFIADMSIWQRIAGAQKHETVLGGLWSSVLGSAATWTVFVLLACFGFMIVGRDATGNPLILLVATIGRQGGVLALIVLFVVTLGLYGAMLSTASTQLIAVSHTIYEDVFSHKRKDTLQARLGSRAELAKSRAILIVGAILSTVLVEVLARVGFSIAELVFAIYGSQVGLCPLVVAALLLRRDQLQRMSDWAASALSAGFVIGWGSAGFGVATKTDILVYLAPALSLAVAGGMLGVGYLVSGARTAKEAA